MLLFGHIGITLGAAIGLDKGLAMCGSFLRRNEKSTATLRLADEAEKIDYRLVLIGSLLPDIIDKPLGQLILADTFSNGRIFAHTLLFALLLLTFGLYRFWWRGKNGFLVVALCSGGHLILDEMWHTPETLFWPLYGMTFRKGDLSNWFSNMWGGLTKEPEVYVPEIIGLMILAFFGFRLLRSEGVLRFLKSGVVR